METDSKPSGMLSIVAALLLPSWWVLPQVLAGLGLLSLLSISCLFWLQRLQPVFLTVALGSLAYEGWLVQRQPPLMRTMGVKAILCASLAINLLVMGSWLVLWFRYWWGMSRSES